MLAALLANLRVTTPSYPNQQGRGKRRSVFWLEQYPKELVDERKKIAKQLKEASERMRMLPDESEVKQRFMAIVAPYRTKPKADLGPMRRELSKLAGKLDHLEMALDKQIRDDINLLLQLADDEEFFLWF